MELQLNKAKEIVANFMGYTKNPHAIHWEKDGSIVLDRDLDFIRNFDDLRPVFRELAEFEFTFKEVPAGVHFSIAPRFSEYYRESVSAIGESLPESALLALAKLITKERL